MIQLSVYDQARKAVQEHKWLESEKAGRDLGHAAVWEWSKSYWLRFYRWRFLQHLRGDIFWQEFAAESFGLVNGRLWAPPKLLDEILDHVRNGAENLDLILWAQDCLAPMDRVIEILEALDINSQRLPPPMDVN